MDWMGWEEDILHGSRFYSNEDAAQLLLPHRSADGIRHKRKLLGAEHLTYCIRCSAPFQRVSKWALCSDCSSDNSRKTNINQRLREYKNSAKKRNIPWELEINDFVKLWSSHCHYCSVKIEGIGIDRIDSSKSYNPKNIVACCSICNRMKGTTSVDEWMSHITKILDGATDGS